MNSRFKYNAKKFIAGVLTLSLTGGMVYYSGTLKSEAQENATLPGIETIVSLYMGNDDVYRILEVVPSMDEASIGFLIGGQEPVLDGKKLSEIPSQDEREAAMEKLESSIAGYDLGAAVSISSYSESDTGDKSFTLKGKFVEDENGEYKYSIASTKYRMLTDGEAANGQRFMRNSTFAINSSGSANTSDAATNNAKNVNVSFAPVPTDGTNTLEATIKNADGTVEKTYVNQRYTVSAENALAGISISSPSSGTVTDAAEEYRGKSVYKKTTTGSDSTYDYYGRIVKGSDINQEGTACVSGGDIVDYEPDTATSGGTASPAGTKVIFKADSLYVSLPNGDIESWLYCYEGTTGKYYAKDNANITDTGDKYICTMSESASGGLYIKDIQCSDTGDYSMTDEYSQNDVGNYVMSGDSYADIMWKGSDESAFAADTRTPCRFVPGEGQSGEGAVELEIKYSGGIDNAEWFKKNVLNLTQDECDSMKVEVKTITLAGLCDLVMNPSKADEYGVSLDGVNMVYLSGRGDYTAILNDEAVKNGLSDTILTLAKMAFGVDGTDVSISSRIPFVIDYDFYRKAGVDLQALVLYLLQAENENIASDELTGFTSGNSIVQLRSELAAKIDKLVAEKLGNSAKTLASVGEMLAGNVYLCNGNIASRYFNTEKTDEVSKLMYQDVADTASYENFLLKQNNLTADIDESISDANIVRYIINWTSKRELLKTSLNILDVEPGGSFDDDLLLQNNIVQYINQSDYDKKNINITHMASAEFIGKIEDLNATYDMIYFGDNLEQFNTVYDNKTSMDIPVYNDSAMKGLVYTHTGDLYTYRYGVESDSDIKRLQNENLSYDNNSYSYRAPGNDINSTRCAELIDYIESGYAVVFADRYFNNAGTDNVSINTTAVDKNSYYYKVMEFALTKDATTGKYLYWNKNVYTENNLYDSTIDSEKNTATAAAKRAEQRTRQETFKKYLNLSKLSIEWEEIGGQAAKPTEYEYTVNSMTTNDDGYVTKIDSTAKMLDGDELVYTFSLKNNSSVSGNAVTYDCKLFIDSNADGRFAGADVSVTDITNSEEIDGLNVYVYDNGTWSKVDMVSDHYELSVDKIYRVAKGLPSGYNGAIPWELVFYNNNNTGIRISETGYTAVKGEGEIKILQLLSDKNNMWNLSTEKDSDGNYADPEVIALLDEVKDIVGFDVEITSITVSDIVKEIRQFSDQWNQWTANYYDTNYITTCRSKAKNIFDGYDMIIVGFSDNYKFGNTSSSDYDEQKSLEWANKAVAEALKDYIDAGNSVLFTHDSSTYIESTAGKENSWYWGYEFNKTLRATLGLDRYGVNMLYYQQQAEEFKNYDKDTGLSDYYNKAYEKLKNEYTYDTISDSGRKEGLTKFTTVRYMTQHLNRLISSQGTGAALSGDGFNFYFPVNNSVFYKALYQVESSENSTSQALFGNYAYDGTGSKLKVSNVNKGQITTYPYTLDDDMTVASTHYQWLQPNMELDKDGDGKNDIVVWYCLSDLDEDAAALKQSKEGSDSNTNIYNLVDKDVVNNYYIYTMGNVTYSGVGHSKPMKLTESNEKRLFINTMVAAYKQGMKAPSIEFRDTSGSATGGVSVMYDSQNGMVLNTGAGANLFSVNFAATDNNILSGKEVRVEFFKPAADNDASAITIDGVNSKVVPISGTDVTVKRKSDNTVVAAVSVASGSYSDTVNSTFAGSSYYSVINGEEYTISFNADQLGIFNSKDGKITINSDGNGSVIYARATTVYNSGSDVTDSSIQQLYIYPAELFELR